MKKGTKILIIAIILVFTVLVNSSVFVIGDTDTRPEIEFYINTRGTTPEGDWTIINTTVINDQTILLDGNLTIISTGNLTLRNIVLVLNCTENGTYHIKVQPGGTLLIENSNITTNNSKYRSYWEVEADSNFSLTDTEISNFGWNETYLGLEIKTDNSYIDNCTFTNCHVGVGLINSDSSQIINCTFKNNFYSIYLERADYNFIHGCEISDGISGIVLVNSSQNNIVSCEVYSHKDPGIFIYYSYNNLIEKCSVKYHTYSYYDFKAKGIFIKNSWGNIVNGSELHSNSNGIYIESSYANVVSNCGFANNLDSGINVYFSTNNLISNCFFANNGRGITLWGGNDCRIENCSINQIEKVGIYLMNANRNIFDNCFISANRDNVFLNGKSLDNIFISCYLESLNLNFNFTHEANVATYETVFDPDKISYTSNSNLTVYWNLFIQVNNSTGDPATNVSINISNYLGEVVFNVSSDEDGYIAILNLPEYFATLDNRTYFSPYTVTAEKDGLINITEIILVNTRHINLTLELPIEPDPEDEDKDDDDDGPFDLTEDLCLCLSVGIITFLGVLLAMNYVARRRHAQKQLFELEADMDKPPPGKVKCSECGAWVLEEASACPRCGETFEGDEFECPGCGALVPDDSDICLKCGKIFVGSTGSEDDKTSKKKGAGKFYCSDCSAVIDENDTFCPACGEIFEDESKDSSKKLKPRKKLKKGKAVDQEFMCSMCGAQVSGGANRCPKCKTEFD